MGGYENRDLGIGLMVDGHHTTIKTMIGRGLKKGDSRPSADLYFLALGKKINMFRTRMAGQ